MLDPVLVTDFVSLCRVVLTKTQPPEKVNPCPECVLISVKISCRPFPQWKGFSVISLPSSSWFFPLKDGAILSAQPWEGAGRLDVHQGQELVPFWGLRSLAFGPKQCSPLLS